MDLNELIHLVESLADETCDDDEDANCIWVHVLMALLELRSWHALFPEHIRRDEQ